MSTVEEIKSCPACGAGHVECGGVIWDGLEDVREKHYVVCLSCMMTGPEKPTKEVAITAWNDLLRREEIYAELTGLAELVLQWMCDEDDSRRAAYGDVRSQIQVIAEKYEPEGIAPHWDNETAGIKGTIEEISRIHEARTAPEYGPGELPDFSIPEEHATKHKPEDDA